MSSAATPTQHAAEATPDVPEGPLPRETVIRGRRGLVGVDWGELIRHRELLGFLIWRDFKVRYKQTVLGLGWAILQPLCFMAIFSLIAMKLDFSDRLGVPVQIFYFAGLLPWTFYSVGVQFSSQSLISQQHLLTKIYLPRVFIPTAVIVTGLIDMAIASTVFVGFMVWFAVVPDVWILMLIPLLVLLLLTTLGFGLLFSGLAVAYRDVRFIVPFFIQGMLFVSAVIFPASEDFVGAKGAWILACNPVTGVVEGFRAALSGGDYPFDWPRLALSAAVGLVIFVIGLTVFRQIERRFADIAWGHEPMTYPALTLDGIGKAYQLGVREPGADGLGAALKSAALAPVRNLRRLSGKSTERELFWALKDVSLEVPAGQVLGIVGRNGAGKSTLLKVLSRITEPTEGVARLRGRVASLIEVGTGFHPELTGRENIYLNGAILGMGRAEIDSKFDEIVAFSEVERFLETPVKRYSSGMFLRLAFAVAAYLEPEILVIDEVLAVGDAAFQKKCLGRMKEVSHGHGRTVLFVSHNMATVRALCDRCVMLKRGQLVADGPPGEVIDQYLDSTMAQSSRVYDLADRPGPWRYGTGSAVFTRLELANSSSFVARTDELDLRCTVRAEEKLDRFRIAVMVHKADGEAVGGAFGPDSLSLVEGEEAEFRVSLPDVNLAPGRCCCELRLGKGNPRDGRTEYDAVFDVLHFEVTPETSEDGAAGYWEPQWGPVKFADCTLERVHG